MKSTFTVTDLLDKAESLIEANGSTTNLDIKNALRADGFQAIQSDVSRMMDDEYQGRNLTFSFNGTFRTYTVAEDDDSDDDDSGTGGIGLITIKAKIPGPISTPIVPSTISYERRDGEVVESCSPTAGAWKIFAKGHENAPAYFSGTYTRAMARQAFANATGVKYIHTRSNTVK